MTTEKLLSRHPLDNGLTLEFWDLSRPMIGDRWIITLELRIAIPINAANLPPDLQAQEADIIRALGAEIVFSQRDERNFIDVKEFDANREGNGDPTAGPGAVVLRPPGIRRPLDS